MKEEEKPAVPWETQDPKPPVIHAGRMEGRVKNQKKYPVA